MNQHFVPRVYLKNFSTKKGKEYFIDVFDKDDGRYFKTNIKNVCTESNLYTLSRDTEINKDILAVENLYAKAIEPMYSRAYNILSNDKVFNISNDERIEIILSIIHFHMRNPRILRRIIKNHKTEISNLYTEAQLTGAKGITYLDEDFSFREWNKEKIFDYFIAKSVKLFKEKHIFATGKIGEFHEFAKMEISIALDDSNFITSDNPLATQDFITKIENPLLNSTEFNLPINKKHSLRIYHDNTVKLNYIQRSFLPNGSVNMINSTIVEQSFRFLFGSRETFEDLSRVENFLNKDSRELMLSFAKQFLNLNLPSEDAIPIKKVLKEYIDKYDKQGFISKEDEQVMMHEVYKLTIAARNRK